MQTQLQHEAVPYHGDDGFLSSCLSLVADGRDQRQRMIFLVTAAKLDRLRDAVGADEDIALVPSDEHGRNPARITTMLHTFQDAADGRACLGVSENVVRSSAAATEEAQLSESILNSPALQSWPMTIACLYDLDERDEADAAAMRRSHPQVRGEADNDTYEPNLAAGLFAARLGDAPTDAAAREVGVMQLSSARGFVREVAARSTLTPDRVDDLVLAANEVISNSLRHGGGRCRLSVWHERDRVVCDVRDDGVISDPLAGRLAPAPTAARGRGLWLANHLCDLVQIRSSHRGTVVRLHVES